MRQCVTELRAAGRAKADSDFTTVSLKTDEHSIADFSQPETMSRTQKLHDRVFKKNNSKEFCFYLLVFPICCTQENGKHTFLYL